MSARPPALDAAGAAAATADADDRDLPSEQRFQHATWTAQRVGWVSMGVLVLAAMLGLFGDAGFQAGTQARLGAGVEVLASDVLRRGDRAFIELRCSAASTQDREPITGAGVDVDRDPIRVTLHGVQAWARVEGVTPEPLRQTASDERLDFWFMPPVDEESLFIRVELTPVACGRRELAAAVEAREPARARFLVWP